MKRIRRLTLCRVGWHSWEFWHGRYYIGAVGSIGRCRDCGKGYIVRTTA